MLTVVAGINWGDEGKGRMVDYLGAGYDVVSRYQGGNNAGHTVINGRGKFVLNLLPSGVFNENTANVLGPGMVIDLEHLYNEIEGLRSRGVPVTPDNLKLSGKAVICMPFHRDQDGLEEDRLGVKKQGSTRRGIGPVYADKYIRKALRVEDIFDFAALRDKVCEYVEWKNLLLERGYGHKIREEEAYAWLRRYGSSLLPFVCDTGEYLEAAANAGKNILFEAQLGALRDIDYGIYPYTSSSTTLAAYAPIGAGIPGRRPDTVIGVIKAFSSCVGEGPFVAEMFGKEADNLRETAEEYGAATGRPRRVGGFDVPASAYGVRLQGADTLALTKLDILSGMERIPVCAAYEIDGVRTGSFPAMDKLLRAKPVVELHEGFADDVSEARSFEDLPAAARKYVEFIEEAVGCHIGYISVGARREQIIVR
ncbi:MAG: adenylosuccinate synthase [Clostridiales bacterium]|jgi:adenylosuccinate synthase|nr:adenylosuccinate synthase [Clostridiales bacterium]